MPGLVSFQAMEPVTRVVTIGTFDGVHLGHAKLISSTRARAAELGARSTIVTFEPVPASVLRPDRFAGRICTAGRKLTLLEAFHTDEIVVIEFNRSLAARSPEDFLAELKDTHRTGRALGRRRLCARPRPGRRCRADLRDRRLTRFSHDSRAAGSRTALRSSAALRFAGPSSQAMSGLPRSRLAAPFPSRAKSSTEPIWAGKSGFQPPTSSRRRAWSNSEMGFSFPAGTWREKLRLARP